MAWSIVYADPVVVVVDPEATTNQYYVRDGGSPTGSGSDWTNARDDLPATLVRGTTYWMAGGSYASRTFNTTAGGAGNDAYIRIKKATIALHGTSTGWLDSYATAQAVFGQITVSTSHHIFDGSYRDESSLSAWFTNSSYGIRINHANGGCVILSDTPYTNLTFRYLFMPSMTETLTGGFRPYNVDAGESNSNGQRTGLLFQRCLTTGGSNHYFIRSSTGSVIEYCALADAFSNATYHGEMFNIYFSVFDPVIRFNFLKNHNAPTAGIAIASWRSSPNAPSGEIYGNVFWNVYGTEELIGYGNGGVDSTSDGDNWKIYNNTIVDCGLYTGSDGVALGEGAGGNDVRNNLWLKASSDPSIDLGGGSNTLAYNAFYGAGSGTNIQSGIRSTIFMNYATGDFRLATDTTAGATLASPYDVDMLGNTRTTWSRGALQKV